MCHFLLSQRSKWFLYSFAVPRPVNPFRTILPILWGHFQLLLFRQWFSVYPRCLVHRSMPAWLSRRAFSARHEDDTTIDRSSRTPVCGYRSLHLRHSAGTKQSHEERTLAFDCSAQRTLSQCLALQNLVTKMAASNYQVSNTVTVLPGKEAIQSQFPL